jgi:hypothetical protein
VAAEPARIRPYRPRDLDALYQVCLQTGRNGGDATALYRDPWLIGHVHAAPYGIFQPSLAFVAEDNAGVGGYILGALDSKAFKARLERDWWPRSITATPSPRPRWPPAIPRTCTSTSSRGSSPAVTAGG